MKKKRNIKVLSKLFVLIMLVATILSFCSCSASYKYTRQGNIEIGYSKNKAFIGKIERDINLSSKIILPSEYNEIKVKELGGYCGKGTPFPFAVHILYDAEKYSEYTGYYSIEEKNISKNDLWDECEIVDYNIEIELPKYLSKIKLVNASNVDVLTKEENDKTIALIIRPTYYFTIDSSNESFYTIDGKLYDKKTNNLYSIFTYNS